MKSSVVKRSIVVAGHKTSVSCENEFWKGLKEIAEDCGRTMSETVAAIDADRQHGNLSSAIRLFVLNHYQEKACTAQVSRPQPGESLEPAKGRVLSA